MYATTTRAGNLRPKRREMLGNAVSPAFLPPSCSTSSQLTQLRCSSILQSASSWIKDTSSFGPSSSAPFARRSGALLILSSLPCRCLKSPINGYAELGTAFAFLQGIGLDENETELLLTQNPDLRMKSFSSLNDRVELLRSVGIDGLDLCHLVTKCPIVLTAEEVDPFICFVRDSLDGKIDAMQIKRALAATHPRFLVGFDEKVNLLISRGVPREKMVHVLDSVNLSKALCMRPMEDIERMIEYLDQFGCFDLIVRRPVTLNSDLDKQLAPRVEYILELSGGDKVATGKLLRKRPTLLNYSVDHVRGHVELLRSFAGLEGDEIFRIFVVFPNVISASKERKLRPRISFLKECGLNSHEIFKFLSQAPLFLGLSFEENLAHKLVTLVKIGYRYKSKELAVAVGAVTRTSCENLQKVVDLFLSYGVSYEDIIAMSRKHPQMLQYNPDSLEEKVEYLMGEMGRGIEELLAFPAFLGYNLDSRIKHRYEVNRKTAGDAVSLNKLLTISAERFNKITKEKAAK